MDLHVLALGAATFLLAGVVKGAIGLGLPTIAMGLLSLAVAPPVAAAVLIVPSMVTNVWQILVGPALRPLVMRLWPMLLGVLVGTLAGSRWIGLAGPWAVTGLGLALVGYGLVGLSPVRLSVPPRAERWAGPAVGLATGLVTAATGVFVIPAVPYLQALGLEKDDLVQALGLSFTVSTVALALGLAQQEAFDVALAAASVAALVPAGLGMVLGQWARGRASIATFRKAFFLGLLALGAHLASRHVL